MILVPTNRQIEPGLNVKVRHPVTRKFVDQIDTDRESNETNKYFSRILSQGDLEIRTTKPSKTQKEIE